MKVLNILSTNTYSGAENVVFQLIKGLKYEFEIAYCSPRGNIEKKLKEENIYYVPIKKLSIKEIKRVINEYNPDIIHAHDFKASILASMTGFKGKIISQIHQTPTFLKTYNIKSLTYLLSAKKYYKIIGVSNEFFENFIFKDRIKNKYVTIYNSLNSKEIQIKANQYEYNKNYDLLFLGRLVNVKNPLRFIQIVEQIKYKIPNIKAVMLGDGILREECSKMIEQKGLNNNIELLGFKDNPFPIIKNCKLMIMTSIWEGIPMSVIESMILSTVVLNNGVGGLKEIFKEIQFLICKNDQEYIEKIEELLSNDEKYKKYVEISSKTAEKFSNIDSWANKFKEIYIQGEENE